MYNIPRYQTGSYIPGLSSQVFGAGLDRDIASEQDRLRKQAKSLGKKQRWGNIGSILGKSGGKWLGKALSAGFAATNPLYALAVQAGGAGLGSYLGSKLGRGDDVSVKSKHGLLGSQYEDIDKYQKGMESAAKGAAWGDAGSVFGQGLKSEAGKQIWGGLDSDVKTEWLGENIGSKTHKELTGMNLGDVLGQGRIAKGVEGWLGKNKPFQSEMWQATKPAREWAWEGAKDIYGAGKDVYQSGQEFFENIPELYELYKNRNQGNIFNNRYQEGGIIGLQEGGSPSDATRTNTMYDLLMQSQIPVYNQYSMQDQDRIDDENEELMNLIIGSIGGKGVSKESFMKLKNIVKRLKDNPIKGKLKPPGHYSKRNLDMQHYHDSPIPSTPPGSPYNTDLTINPFSGKYFDRNFADESGEIWDLVDALKKSGMQEGGMARSIGGAQPVEWNYDDPEMLRALFSVPADQVGEGEGLRYYSAEKPYTQLANLDRKVLFNRAVQGMASAPQDSIPSDMVENYFDKPKSNFLQKLFGKQEGGYMSEENYPLQMAGGGYMPEQGFGGLIQHRKGY